jgi:hypothetical protein
MGTTAGFFINACYAKRLASYAYAIALSDAALFERALSEQHKSETKKTGKPQNGTVNSQRSTVNALPKLNETLYPLHLVRSI